jgi:hypothetical protein
MVDLIYLCSENSTPVVGCSIAGSFKTEREPTQPLQAASAARRWTRLSLADRARVVERYEAGEVSTDLAIEFGVAKTTILAILREANVVRRRQPLTPRQVADATALYESGRSLSQVAAKTRLKQDTIRVALKAAGVKLRPPTGG